MNWYYCNDGTNVVGPLPGEAIDALRRCGTINDDTLVVAEGSADWKTVGEAFKVEASAGLGIDVGISESSGYRDAQNTPTAANGIQERDHPENNHPPDQEPSVAGNNMPSRKLVVLGAGGAVLAVVVLAAMVRSGLGSKGAWVTKEANSHPLEPNAATGVYIGDHLDRCYEVLGKQNITKAFRFEGHRKAAFTYLIFDGDANDLTAVGFDESDIARVLVCMLRDGSGKNASLDDKEIARLLARFSKSGARWVRMEDLKNMGDDSAWGDVSSVTRGGDGSLAWYDSEAKSLIILKSRKDLDRAMDDLSRARVEDLSNIEVRRAPGR